MIKLVSFLLTGCWHKWNLYKEIKLFDPKFDKERPFAIDYILKCEHCGDMKKRRL